MLYKQFDTPRISTAAMHGIVTVGIHKPALVLYASLVYGDEPVICNPTKRQVTILVISQNIPLYRLKCMIDKMYVHPDNNLAHTMYIYSPHILGVSYTFLGNVMTTDKYALQQESSAGL